MKEIGRLWAIEKGGKSTPKAKAKPKPRSVRTTSSKKPEKKARKTAKQKSVSRSVPVSAEEKKSQKAFDVLEQCRLALSVPKSDWKIKPVKKGWTWNARGFGKSITKKKISDLAKAVKDRTRSYI